jgi:hypothetical protein
MAVVAVIDLTEFRGALGGDLGIGVELVTTVVVTLIFVIAGSAIGGKIREFAYA